MATKTVTLTGGELCVDELGGLNALIVNNTDVPLYASAKAGIEPYADGVIEIKAGASRGLPDTNGTVYVLGNGGRAEITGTSAEINFSMPPASEEGGGVTEAEVDGIVTEKIAEVVANAPEDFDTLREIADWIDGHKNSAAAMNSEIKANAADISAIQAEQQTQNADISALQSEIEQISGLRPVTNDEIDAIISNNNEAMSIDAYLNLNGLFELMRRMNLACIRTYTVPIAANNTSEGSEWVDIVVESKVQFHIAYAHVYGDITIHVLKSGRTTSDITIVPLDTSAIGPGVLEITFRRYGLRWQMRCIHPNPELVGRNAYVTVYSFKVPSETGD